MAIGRNGAVLPKKFITTKILRAFESYVDGAVGHVGALASGFATLVIQLEASHHALVLLVLVHLVAHQRNLLLAKHPNNP